MSFPGLINVGQPHSVWHTSDKPRIAISIEFMNRKGVFEPFSKLTKRSDKEAASSGSCVISKVATPFCVLNTGE